MPYGLEVGDAIAAIALFLSAYAIWSTARFNTQQISLIRTQEELNELLLKQGKNEVLDAYKADLGANFIKIASNKYRLKIFNKGKATARNVRVEFPDGNEPIIRSELRNKFPLEILERHQSVELIAAVHFGTKMKHRVRLLWTDEASEANEKIVYLTI